MRLSSLVFAAGAVVTAGALQVRGTVDNVAYRGIARDNGIEAFLGIRYAHHTGGENRFKPPIPFVPVPGSVIDATRPGAACPQQLGQLNAPLAMVNITVVSEDCLNLNIVRPKPDGSGEKLPVMVWIHGGSFW